MALYHLVEKVFAKQTSKLLVNENNYSFADCGVGQGDIILKENIFFSDQNKNNYFRLKLRVWTVAQYQHQQLLEAY